MKSTVGLRPTERVNDYEGQNRSRRGVLSPFHLGGFRSCKLLAFRHVVHGVPEPAPARSVPEEGHEIWRVKMADRDDKVTVVETGGGGGGLIAGILVAIVVVFALFYLFGGELFSGGGSTVDINVDTPNVGTPAGD